MLWLRRKCRLTIWACCLLLSPTMTKNERWPEMSELLIRAGMRVSSGLRRPVALAPDMAAGGAGWRGGALRWGLSARGRGEEEGQRRVPRPETASVRARGLCKPSMTTLRPCRAEAAPRRRVRPPILISSSSRPSSRTARPPRRLHQWPQRKSRRTLSSRQGHTSDVGECEEARSRAARAPSSSAISPRSPRSLRSLSRPNRVSDRQLHCEGERRVLGKAGCARIEPESASKGYNEGASERRREGRRES